jgi:hypothetical protein
LLGRLPDIGEILFLQRRQKGRYAIPEIEEK